MKLLSAIAYELSSYEGQQNNFHTTAPSQIYNSNLGWEGEVGPEMFFNTIDIPGVWMLKLLLRVLPLGSVVWFPLLINSKVSVHC